MNSERAYRALRERLPTWEDVRRAPRSTVEKLWDSAADWGTG